MHGARRAAARLRNAIAARGAARSSAACPLARSPDSTVGDVPVVQHSRMMRDEDGPMFADLAQRAVRLQQALDRLVEVLNRRRGALVAPPALRRRLYRGEIAEQPRDQEIRVHLRWPGHRPPIIAASC